MALSQDAEAALVRRPDAPDHFMRIKPVQKRVTVMIDGVILAETASAKRVIEFGRDIYDPVLYIPRDDLQAEFKTLEKSTRCPLKGEASYHSAKLSDAQWADEIAWSYDKSFDFASEIKGLVAFDSSRVTITEAPLS
ncbi:MAG: DUF427 domain-containing protein [Pseudomonadota bacterium]